MNRDQIISCFSKKSRVITRPEEITIHNGVISMTILKHSLLVFLLTGICSSSISILELAATASKPSGIKKKPIKKMPHHNRHKKNRQILIGTGVTCGLLGVASMIFSEAQRAHRAEVLQNYLISGDEGGESLAVAIDASLENPIDQFEHLLAARLGSEAAQELLGDISFWKYVSWGSAAFTALAAFLPTYLQYLNRKNYDREERKRMMTVGAELLYDEIRDRYKAQIHEAAGVKNPPKMLSALAGEDANAKVLGNIEKLVQQLESREAKWRHVQELKKSPAGTDVGTGSWIDPLTDQTEKVDDAFEAKTKKLAKELVEYIEHVIDGGTPGGNRRVSFFGSSLHDVMQTNPMWNEWFNKIQDQEPVKTTVRRESRAQIAGNKSPRASGIRRNKTPKAQAGRSDRRSAAGARGRGGRVSRAQRSASSSEPRSVHESR